MQLSNFFNLSHTVKLYVPSTMEVDKVHVSNAYQVAKITEIFNALFGGSTKYDAVGSWNMQSGKNKGKAVDEKVTVVQSFGTTEQMEQGLDTVVKLAQEMKKEMKQEAISLEYDNVLYLI